MNLTKADVEHVAALARLHVTEDEKAVLAGELSRILEYASELQRLDLQHVAATSQIGIEHTVTRSDVAERSLPPEVVMANAPDEEEQQFRVPAVLEG